jgi:hypothetical protein
VLKTVSAVYTVLENIHYFLTVMKRRDANTYVGDLFTVSFPKYDKDPLAVLNGQECELIGFRANLQHIFPHRASIMDVGPGIYSTFGNPLVRLETNRIVEMPMSNLVPHGYRFDDMRFVKNRHYRDASDRLRFVGPLPYAHNVGDVALVAKHHGVKDDFAAPILDVDFHNGGVVYAVEYEDRLKVIRSEMVIDLLELGHYTEEERYWLQMKTLERIMPSRRASFKYDDMERFIDE